MFYMLYAIDEHRVIVAKAGSDKRIAFTRAIGAINKYRSVPLVIMTKGEYERGNNPDW